MERVDFDVIDLVEKAVEIMAIRAHAKGLELTYRVHPAVPGWVAGDPGRLRQVLLNLLGNAIKFTEKGEVRLTVEPLAGPAAEGAGSPDRSPASGPSAAIRFSVHDTGIGVPADKLDLIFERFTQVDASTTRKYGGSGLGLTISKRLAELMGGRIWVESEAGRGSTFSFAVPLPPAAPPSPPVAAPSVDLRGVRTLLIDDNATNASSSGRPSRGGAPRSRRSPGARKGWRSGPGRGPRGRPIDSC